VTHAETPTGVGRWTSRSLAGLAVLVLVISAAVGPTPTDGAAFASWATAEYGLTPAGGRCVQQRIARGPLAGTDLGPAAVLARDGLAAVPLTAQQVLGDLVLACALETNPRR
jgi:hypothetical protein